MRHGDIEDCYREIFAKDPLLLEKESQDEYAAALLKHLLLNRTTNAVLPMLVDIFDKRERDWFSSRPRFGGPHPASPVVDMYREKRSLREKLTPSEREALGQVTMVSRGEFTTRRRSQAELDSARAAELRADPSKPIPRTISYTLHDRAVKKLDKRPSSIANRLRIAALGYRVQVSKLDDQGVLGEELSLLSEQRGSLKSPLGESDTTDFGRTFCADATALDEWKRAVEKYVNTALHRKCHFIILPEFALPPDGEANAIVELLHDRARAPDTPDHFMFAGSRHERGGNFGLILSRQNGRTSVPWWHKKIASARTLGENIVAPYGIKRASYTADFQVSKDERPNFPIDVAICYDAFDPTVFLALIMQSIISTDDEIRPRILMVPSFNTSRDFTALLRDLSFLSRSIVIYVNGLHGEAKMFIGGFAVSDFCDNASVARLRDAIRKKASVLRKRRSDLLLNPKLDIKESAQSTNWNIQAEALEILDAKLENLEKAGALEHMITVEAHAPKRPQSARFDKSDILYYNIDMGFIDALLNFRSKYFAGDKFLAAPFHYDSLKRVAFEMRDKVKNLRRKEGMPV